MPAYKYTFKKNEYWYFKCCVNSKQYSIRFSESGDRFYRKREAELAEVRFLSSLKKDKEDCIYFYELYDPFEKYLYKRYRNTTATRNLNTFKNHIYPFFENKRISRVDDSLVDKINDYINKLKYKDPKGLFKVAAIWIKFLNDEYKIELNGSKLYKFQSNEFITNISNYNYYTFEEFMKLVSVIDDPYWELLFSVLYYYGLRISELRGIIKLNFSKERLMIDRCVTNRTSNPGQSITSTKSQSSVRVFPMFPNIYSLYEKCINSKSDYVFYSFDNKKMTVGETTIRRYLKRYCDKANVKVIKIHEFRHSCASLLINNGLDATQVASWMGHSSANVTYKVYFHLFDRKKNEIYNFLENLQSK